MQKRALFLLAAAGLFAADLHAREGFGFTKKAVDMNRTHPPSLNIGARRVKILTTAERAKETDDVATLRRYLEEAILSGAGTLATEKNGDIAIKISLDRLDANESWQTRTETHYQKVGSHQEWNSSKKKYETKDDYANVPVTKNVKVMKGTLAGAYDIVDKAGKFVDSGNLTEDFKEKYDDGNNAPSTTKLEDDMIKRAARMVAAKIVPTQDRVQVIMPKGSFEAFIPIAESNAWDRYLAAVEAVPANRNPSQEAYRQYALAIGREGLAYATDDRVQALDLLRQAMNHYETAVRSNHGERIFSEAYSSILSVGSIPAPLARAQASLTAYETWNAGAGGRRSTTTAASSGKGGSGSKPATVMTNEMLLDMSKAGLTEENLMLAIDSADQTDFDTTPGALITLAKGGVSRNVIAHMQKKQARKTSR